MTRTLKLRSPLGLALLAAVACDPLPGPDAGPTPECAPDPAPGAHIGRGIGGAFQELADGEEVGIAVAPQGGFGVSVVLETTGLRAADDSRVNVDMSIDTDEEQLGQFTLYQQPLLCAASGGRVNGVVVGFDPSRFSSNDALVELDGRTVVLSVVVVDDLEGSAEAHRPVTVRVGG